jgi:hypothetical protein
MRTANGRPPAVVVTLIQQPTATTLRSYAAELPSDILDTHGQIIDGMIGFVFETLNAHCLNLRVVPVAPLQPTVHNETLVV